MSSISTEAAFRSSGSVSFRRRRSRNSRQPCTNPGRIKPDVLAPGSSITSASNADDTSYRANNFGTSFAAPGIAGAAALVRDYFAQEIYPTESSDLPITNPLAPSAARAFVSA